MPTARPSWSRLELRPRDPTLEAELRAEVCDPLWLLARQWQFGEFTGDDGGSPVQIQLELDCSPITRYLPGQPDGTPGTPYDSRQQPLEELVEAEPAQSDEERPLRLAATAGQHFLGLLANAGVGHYQPSYLRQYPLEHDPADRERLGAAARGFLIVLAGRTLDGTKLHQDLAALRGPDGELELLPAEPAIRAEDTPMVLAAARAFLAWYPAAANPATPAQSAWSPARLEYRMAVASLTPDGEVVLTAAEYDRGHLDWHAFDLAAAGTPSLGAQPDDQQRTPIVTVGRPTPVIFLGMPLPRYWQFEDAAVDFGDLTDDGNLTRLLLIQFGLVYGNDHFLVPVDLEVGTVNHIRSLRVIDTFGVRTDIPSAAEADAVHRPGKARFRLFTLHSTDPTAIPEYLVLPPVLGPSLHSDPLEEVHLLYDEGANLGWAVEARAAPPGDFPVDRAAANRTQRQSTGSGDSPGGENRAAWEWRYQLRTLIPGHWFPLVPITETAGSNHLELGVLPPIEEEGPTPTPWGRLLGELAGISDPTHQRIHVPEEELARTGTRITRAWQYARWIDGRQHAWVSRRREQGIGAGSSGLRFDTIDPTGAGEAT